MRIFYSPAWYTLVPHTVNDNSEQFALFGVRVLNLQNDYYPFTLIKAIRSMTWLFIFGMFRLPKNRNGRQSSVSLKYTFVMYCDTTDQ